MFSASLIQQSKMKAQQQMSAHPNAGWFYAAHNKHIGDVLNRNIFEKFGQTERPDPTIRVSELQQEYKSMSPFVADRMIRVHHVEAVERAFHEFFDDIRVLSNREFFDISDAKMQKMQMQIMNMLLMAADGKEWEPESSSYLADEVDVASLDEDTISETSTPPASKLTEILSLTYEDKSSPFASLNNVATPMRLRRSGLAPVLKVDRQENNGGSRPKFQIIKSDGLKVVTPTLCFIPEKAKYSGETLTINAMWRESRNAFVDKNGREFAELSDLAKYHSELLGWSELADRAKRTGIVEKISHKPYQTPGNHGPSYTSYGWREFRYMNERGELCPIADLSYQVR